MRLKNIVLIGILILYAGYYVGVSKGFTKTYDLCYHTSQIRKAESITLPFC